MSKSANVLFYQNSFCLQFTGIMIKYAPLALLALPVAAQAAAPNDLTGSTANTANGGMGDSMTLWLDGMDILARERSNQFPENPTVSQSLPMWYNKSESTMVRVGNASPPVTTFDPVYSTSFGVDYYNGASGVYFRGTNSALEVTGNDIVFPNSDIFIVATPTASTSSAILWNSEASATSASKRIGISLPYSNGIVYWDYGSANVPGRVQYSGGVPLNTATSWRFRITPGQQTISRNGAVVASTTSTATYDYSQGVRRRLIGVGFPNGTTTGPYPGFQGTIHEVIAFSRTLSETEVAILSTYLAGKYNLTDSNNLLNFSTGYRYHIGGIGGGQFVGVGTKVGTSAGLTVANQLGGSSPGTDYTLFGVNAVIPAVGLIFSGEQGFSGYARGRAGRIWYVQQTAQATYGTMTMSVNLTGSGLTGLGITNVPNGSRAALLRRAGQTGDWTVVATGTTSNGSVSFGPITKATGYYTIALDNPPAPSISGTTTIQLLSDGVNGTTNPKHLPGSLSEITVTATNSGAASPDANSSVVQYAVPSGLKLFVGDLGAAGSGPVAFVQGSPSSGLTYTYTSLASTTDMLDFSNPT